ncbi:TIGR03086 family metal-binding protein [Sphaerisporangium sp. B11E5]|uniref:TIGR03086 family metal-binding protein n=1 Tax=Sphaerisporangium sp. B11E5 TaxID=3153563 RepID=UPI00325ED0FB
MDPRTAVEPHHHAWEHRAGDTSQVPLADDRALLEESFALVTSVIGQIGPQGWTAASPCRKWTVRQTANHLAGGLLLLARFAEDDAVDAAEVDAQRQADTDHLGGYPVTAFAAITDRSLAAFTAPGTLEREHAFMGTDVPGSVLASISLLESLIHGWDIATGAHLPYPARDDIIQAVWHFATTDPAVEQGRGSQFTDALPVLPTATPRVRLLAHLGRHADA